ncbi:hypothetical protein LL13F57_42680 [Escherichia coli]
MMSLLALLHHISYPILAHRLTGSFRASFPRPVALTQLHFLLLAVASSREAPMLGAHILHALKNGALRHIG